MAIIKVSWTKAGQKVHLLKMNWKWNEPTVLDSSTLTGYPYSFQYEEKEHETLGKMKSIKFQLAHNGKSHLIQLWHSSCAKGVIDCLKTVTNPTVDEAFEISFYNTKSSDKSYANSSVKRLSTNEKLSWAISQEEKAKLITRTKKKDGTVEVDSYDYDQCIKQFCEELNELFPKSQAVSTNSKNALDELEDDMEQLQPTASNKQITTEEIDINDIPF